MVRIILALASEAFTEINCFTYYNTSRGLKTQEVFDNLPSGIDKLIVNDWDEENFGRVYTTQFFSILLKN